MIRHLNSTTADPQRPFGDFNPRLMSSSLKKTRNQQLPPETTITYLPSVIENNYESAMLENFYHITQKKHQKNPQEQAQILKQCLMVYHDLVNSDQAIGKEVAESVIADDGKTVSILSQFSQIIRTHDPSNQPTVRAREPGYLATPPYRKSEVQPVKQAVLTNEEAIQQLRTSLATISANTPITLFGLGPLIAAFDKKRQRFLVKKYGLVTVLKRLDAKDRFNFIQNIAISKAYLEKISFSLIRLLEVRHRFLFIQTFKLTLKGSFDDQLKLLCLFEESKRFQVITQYSDLSDKINSFSELHRLLRYLPIAERFRFFQTNTSKYWELISTHQLQKQVVALFFPGAVKGKRHEYANHANYESHLDFLATHPQGLLGALKIFPRSELINFICDTKGLITLLNKLSQEERYSLLKYLGNEQFRLIPNFASLLTILPFIEISKRRDILWNHRIWIQKIDENNTHLASALSLLPPHQCFSLIRDLTQENHSNLPAKPSELLAKLPRQFNDDKRKQRIQQDAYLESCYGKFVNHKEKNIVNDARKILENYVNINWFIRLLAGHWRTSANIQLAKSLLQQLSRPSTRQDKPKKTVIELIKTAKRELQIRGPGKTIEKQLGGYKSSLFRRLSYISSLAGEDINDIAPPSNPNP